MSFGVQSKLCIKTEHLLCRCLCMRAVRGACMSIKPVVSGYVLMGRFLVVTVRRAYSLCLCLDVIRVIMGVHVLWVCM